MTQSVGERLKSARESKGFSIEEASKMTKMQRKILEAIEGDRVVEELDPAYAKIFIKKYAHFLGLDGADLVEEFISAHGPLPDRPLSVQTEVTQTASRSSIQKLIVPSLFVVGALLGLSLIVWLGHPKSPRAAVEKKPISSAVSAKPAEAAPKLLVPRSQPLKLTVVPKADVWIQMKSDGVIIYQNVLPKGTQKSWTAKGELELWTGNAGAMELSLNGKPLEGLGSGVKKGVKVTHEGLKLSR